MTANNKRTKRFPFRRYEILGVSAVLLVGAIPVFWLGLKHTEPQKSGSFPYGKVAPDIQEHIDQKVVGLSQESLEKSLARLSSDVQAYFWPGNLFPLGSAALVPLPRDDKIGPWEIGTILSNRRFVKVLQEVGSLSKAEANALVTRQIRATLPKYKAHFQQDLEGRMDDLKLGNQRTAGFGMFWSDQVDGPSTLAGTRLKLLALVLLAGHLGLHESQPAVISVAREAFQQYETLSNKEKFDLTGTYSVITWSSLYNRQILATALVGTAKDGDQAKAVVEKMGITWQSEDLPAYDARATAFDIHAARGFAPIDYSKGKFTVKYLAPLDDAEFAAILKAIKP